MVETSLRKWTGMAGIATFALIVATVPLYFVYSGPPPAWNVLARSLVAMFSMVALLGFVVGLQALAHRERPEEEALTRMLGALGVVLVAVDLVATALESGTVLGRAEPLDPTLVGSGAEGALVMYGPVGRILTAAFLAAAGVVSLRARLLPAGVARAALALSAVQLAFVATYFSGTDPTHFFSINGWHLPVVGGLLGLWILAASVTLLRRS
jgi:hypothetical protein